MKALMKDKFSAEWLEFIEFHQQTKEFGANEVILQQGEPVVGIYSITEGQAKVMIKDNGEDRLIRLAGEGDILGHRGFGGNWTYPISAIALVPTKLGFLPLHTFEVIAKTNPVFSYELMIFLAEELRASEENHLMLPVLNRVARTLIMNYRAFGFAEGSNCLSFTITRKDISTHAATTYESVIRALADLAKHKVILLDGKSICILDLPRLVTLSSRPEEL